MNGYSSVGNCLEVLQGRHKASWGWQAVWCRLGNGAGGDEGSVQAEIQMGIFTNGAFTETTGEQKIKAWGVGKVSEMSNTVERDNVKGGMDLRQTGHWR